MNEPETAARREIERLIYHYAELQDAADWDALDELLAHAEFEATSGESWKGHEIIGRRRRIVVTYDDGTPRSRHVTTNLVIEVDEAGDSATAESYYTIFQAPPGTPLQPIASGRYLDRLERVDGRWRFAYRASRMDLPGQDFETFRRSSKATP